VSIDDATAETFEAIRHGAQHDVVVEHLRGLLRVRGRLGLTRPFVQLNTVAMRGNLHELTALVRLAADLGVDRLWFQGLSHDFRDVEQDPEFLQIRSWTDVHLPDAEELRRATGEAARLAAELGVDIRFPADGEDAPRAAGEPGCDWPWRSAYVTYDGRVQACCMLMGRDRGVVGSIGDQPFGEVWNDEPYQRLREQLVRDEPPDMCAGCAVYHRRF
jgi:radical SAM protein with 4Fe4S-binding SPASM domain